MEQKTIVTKITNRLNTNQRIFFAEFIGISVVVILATGVEYLMPSIGHMFIAFAPFIGVAVGVYLFGKISMAHFNPAVTVGF